RSMTGLTTIPRLEPRETSATTSSGRRTPRRLLLFHLGGQAYALPLHDVAEIVPMAALSGAANLPSVLAGFLNLAGQAIPVVRLDRLFELPELTPGRYTPLILVRHPDSRLALMVENVSRIVTLPEDAVLPIDANESFNDTVEGMATIDG